MLTASNTNDAKDIALKYVINNMKDLLESEINHIDVLVLEFVDISTLIDKIPKTRNFWKVRFKRIQYDFGPWFDYESIERT